MAWALQPRGRGTPSRFLTSMLHPHRAGPLPAAPAASELQASPWSQGARGTGGGRLRLTEPGGRKYYVNLRLCLCRVVAEYLNRAVRVEITTLVKKPANQSGLAITASPSPSTRAAPPSSARGSPSPTAWGGCALRGPGSCPRPGASPARSCPNSSPSESGSSSFGSGGYKPRQADGAHKRES